MKIFVWVLFMGMAASCSHHHKEPEHHHHAENTAKGESVAFKGKCPYAIMNGDLHTKGTEEYSLVHDGETYYFSSKENLDKFKKDFNSNISKAKRRYGRGRTD
jgi:YHS domain-containing protein